MSVSISLPLWIFMKCNQCHIGRYQDRTAPYLEYVLGEILLIPDVPVQVCDICGHLQYDAQFMDILAQLKERLSLPATVRTTTLAPTLQPIRDWSLLRRKVR